MTRTEAVQRINDGIGFRAAGNALEGTIIKRLQEAQRDLENGKTLPKFLIQEDQTLNLVAGQHTVALPTGFLRDVDTTGIRFYVTTTSKPRFLRRRELKEAIEASWFVSESTPDQPARTGFPRFYVIRKSVIDFITTADTNYTLIWDYYKAAALLTADIENEWLANGPAADWLIGEAGWRVSQNLVNQPGAGSFDAMRQAGRAAVFGELLADELSSGPLQMGANQ